MTDCSLHANRSRIVNTTDSVNGTDVEREQRWRGNLTPFTNGWRAGAQHAAFETYADNLAASELADLAAAVRNAHEDMSDLDHRPSCRWHE